MAKSFNVSINKTQIYIFYLQFLHIEKTKFAN